MHQHRYPTDQHRRAPYAEALARHAARSPLMFMVPGHAATPGGMSSALAEFCGSRGIAMDIPQLVAGIDTGADSPFARAELLAADAWNARRSWFLANGSSQGNRMAVLALAGRGAGDRIVAQRSAHSSLTDGLIASGLAPRFVQPAFDRALGINHGITPDQLAHELEALDASGEHACAAYVISPSYFGAVSDIRGLAEVAHRHGVPLIVDAAWGAHFGFHAGLPEFPTTLGADVVVTSTHKMGGSLSQSAMIHLGDGPYAHELEGLIERAHHMTQTTSASSLLLGSLDVARQALMTRSDLIGSSIELAAGLRSWVRRHGRLEAVSDRFGEFPDIADADPLRVSIDVTATGLTGYEVRSALAEDHGILLEVATVGAVVAFLGPGKELDVSRLQEALETVIGDAERIRYEPASRVLPAALEPPVAGEPRMTPREAYFAPSETVPFTEAAGRISADSLAAYPPGIPNVAPGEVIGPEAVEFLRSVAASPIGHVRGAVDPAVDVFRVVARTQRDAER